LVESGNQHEIPLVDPERMQDLMDNLGIDGLRDVIETYLEDSPRQIADLRAAFERGYLDDLQRIAHSLKSSSGIFGAHEMVELCRALEAGTQEGVPAGMGRISQIEEAYARVRDVLNLYLQ
jgi:HPt (histidine-containing phosphotransfer) domain-containing protein